MHFFLTLKAISFLSMSIVQFQEDQGITMSPVGFIPSCQQKDCEGFESEVDTERLSVCPVLMLDGHFIVYNIMGWGQESILQIGKARLYGFHCLG